MLLDFFKKFIKTKDKSFLHLKLMDLLRKLSRTGLAQWAVCFIVLRSIYKISPPSNNPQRVRILVLNHIRFGKDLISLSKDKRFECWVLPFSIQALINSIWFYDIRSLIAKDRKAFFENQIPEVKKIRHSLHCYLVSLLKKLSPFKKWWHFDVVMTGGFAYINDKEWETACGEVGLPFFVIHKESTIDPVIFKEYADLYLDQKWYTKAKRVLVYNQLSKELLVAGKICEPSQVEVIGVPRMDEFYHLLQQAKPQPKKQIVLFSPNFRMGGIYTDKANNGYFDRELGIGFIKYFDILHSAVAQFALENPDVSVIIKTKWLGDWVEAIRIAVHDRLNIELDSISNLTVTNEGSMYELLSNAKVVIGINSTSLLEAKLFGTPVIMPLFAEAVDVYFNSNVYFHRYFDVFDLVYSSEELQQKLKQIVNSNQYEQKPMPLSMIQEYLGYFDGKARDRLYNSMRAVASAP